MRTETTSILLACVVASLLAAAAPSVAARPAAAGADGGILRVDLASGIRAVDPAAARFGDDWQLQFFTGARLLSLPDKAGAAGARIVPEVAKSMPAISKDKKSYTFTLRSGWKLSNGQTIDANMFSYAFDRVANPKMNSPGNSFISDIVGEKAVAAGRAKHISGIKALGKYKLRFTLTHVAPDFPARLTMPYFSAVQLGLPALEGGYGAPFPSGGPYYVAAFQPGKSAVLLENPLYKGPRSHHVDQIAYSFGIPFDAQRARVENGQTDIASVLPGTGAEQLANQYGINQGRFFVNSTFNTFFLVFNTESPLFKGNAPLRRAVSHAIDRPQMVRQHGALGGARTDQILPIDFPGFRNWNIYSLNGADVDKAKREASGHLRTGKVRFWTFNSSFGPSVAQVVQFDLKQIGLDTDITVLDRVTQTTRAGTRGAEFDMLLNGWGEDYPDPYQFINILLSGTSIEPDRNVNLSYFNEASWNKRMDQAAKQFGAARLHAYSVLDRDLMRGPAPVAPYINTNARILVSSRVTNYVYHKVYGTDFAAISLK